MRPIYLSAGHSGTDPGAVSGGRREADIAVEFRNIVSFYLSRAGVPHELDGEGTANLPLAETVKRTRQLRGIEVEFHCNAAVNRGATGVESLQGPANTLLGEKLCQAVADGLALRNRGAKPENAGQHHRLAFVQAGGVILELLFITNPADVAAYDARKWLAARNVAAVLIAEAT